MAYTSKVLLASSLIMKEFSRRFWTGIVFLAVLLVAGLVSIYVLYHPRTATKQDALADNHISYFCAEGTFSATFATSSLALTLSDGRALTLAQARSGSGMRYESVTGDVTFVGKGSDAFLEEKGAITYSNCVAGVITTSAHGQTFTDFSKTFSFEYAAPLRITGGDIGYSTDWMVNATTSGLVLATVNLSKSFAPSTNFSEAKLTVGTSADEHAVATCLTYAPSGAPAAPATTTINGATYTVLHESDAGAGNFYETTSYRTVRDNQCYVVEYTIHSTNIGNYSPDQGIVAYDKARITGLLEGVVRSFIFLNTHA